jgi:ABC-type multidrug transport system fused ATPase/permease subunit
MRTIGVSPMEAIVLPRVAADDDDAAARLLRQPVRDRGRRRLLLDRARHPARHLCPAHARHHPDDRFLGDADQGAGVRRDDRPSPAVTRACRCGRMPRRSGSARPPPSSPRSSSSSCSTRCSRSSSLRSGGLMSDRRTAGGRAGRRRCGAARRIRHRSVRGLKNSSATQVVHDHLDLDVRSGEILGVVGGSGTGKSVLMRSIIGLQTPTAGEIEVFGDARHDRPTKDRGARSASAGA